MTQLRSRLRRCMAARTAALALFLAAGIAGIALREVVWQGAALLFLILMLVLTVRMELLLACPYCKGRLVRGYRFRDLDTLAECPHCRRPLAGKL